jgi:hypothetical protein
MACQWSPSMCAAWLASTRQRCRRERSTAAVTDRTRTPMATKISRAVYAEMFGPTVGDRVRLADTDLIIEVEKDFTTMARR